MINAENLQKMYTRLKDRGIVRRQDILECGFKNHDISSLMERGLIEKVGYGQYRIVNNQRSFNEDFEKCLELLENTSIEEAKKLFLECFVADSKYMDKLFELVFEEIRKKNYSLVFKYFELVLATNAERYIRDVKFYLYLLNYLTDIPEKYKELVEILSSRSVKIMLPDDRYGNISEQNTLRYFAIVKKRFDFCEDGILTVYERIVKVLVWDCDQIKRGNLKEIDLYIEKKDYSKLVEVLVRREKEYGLSSREQLILLVGRYIIDAKNGNISFKISSEITNDWHKAIEIGNFSLAMQLLEKERHTSYSIYSLLEQLVGLVSKINSKEKFNDCINLLENNSVGDAKKLFLECIQVDRTYLDILFELILKAIEGKNYLLVFNYFELVLSCDDDRYIREVKFYLYLLNYLTDIPEKYKKFINGLKYQDVMISAEDDRYSGADNILLINKSRKKIFESGYCNTLSKDKLNTVLERLDYRLKRMCNMKVKWFKSRHKVCLSCGKYDDLLAVLSAESKRRRLSQVLILSKLITGYIVDVMNGNITFTVSNDITDNWAKAIEIGNFSLALRLIEAAGNDEGMLYVLLQQLVTLLEKKQLDIKFKDCINLLKDNSVEEAKKLFLECIQVDRTYLDKLFELILNAIEDKNYLLIFNCFELVLSSDDDRYIRDVKFYLYLLNYITIVPDKYIGLINELKYGDVSLDEQDNRYDDIRMINNVRHCALHGEKYDLDEVKCRSTLDHVNFKFWQSYSEKVRYSHHTLNFFVASKDYALLIESLNYEGERRNLSKGLLLLKDLAQCTLNIKKGILPRVTTEVVDNEYDAVNIGNFELAYKLREARKKLEDNVGDDTILALLKDIIDILNIDDEQQKDKDTLDDKKITYDDLVVKLVCESERDVDYVLGLLPSYLEGIGKSEYEFLIANLIKICDLEQKKGYDSAFDGPLVVLAQIKAGTFVFDLQLYEKYFYEAVKLGELNIAKCYLDIILGYSSMGFISTDDLNKLVWELENAKCINDLARVTGENGDNGSGYYYGIETAEELMRNIEATNLGIEEACLQLGIDSETMNFIRLIYARNYFSCGLDDIGNKFLNSVEKSKGKSPELKAALEEVRCCSMFYANQGPFIDIKKLRIFKP